MRRATVLFFIAVLALVLVYPATTPSARTPGSQDTPTIQIITPENGGVTPAYTGEGDGGDADDLAGFKGRKEKPVGTSGQSDFVIQARWAFEVWRMYVFGFRLYR